MLITTIAQLRAASSVNVSNSVENWLPYLADAEDMFIIPAIGQSLYDAILDSLESVPVDVIESADPISDPGVGGHRLPPTNAEILEALILKVRKALALYALYLGIDEMSVSVSSAGIQVLQSDTHKPAPQYQIMNLKETYLTRAHRQVDLILSFISKNVDQLPDCLPPVAPYFLRNAEEFQLQCDIHSSRRVFLSLMPIIGSIEKKYIKPTLSAGLFDSLKTDFQTPEALTDDEQVLIDMILPALAHLTLARALLEISIDVLDWGIFNNSTNTFNSMATKNQANMERISIMREENQRDGEAELKMLQEFLDNNANASRYAAYFESSRFAGTESAVKRGQFVNESSKSIFVV
ncbi:MAG: hypothetical protein NT040_11225 [Bacteroidetes bacterium]|nr:hypothetical protein [Bacteroidota bacterium]